MMTATSKEDHGIPNLVIKCFNGKTFSEFQLAANFFFETTFTGWLNGDNVTYIIPPLFRCKSEGYVIEAGVNEGVIGNIRGDDNELDLYLAFEKLNTKPQIGFHSFRLKERLKTYNKLLLPYYQCKHNPYEIHAKEILRHIDENSRREDAECDFMVLDKERGVFLFEVKSSLKGRNDAKQQLEIDQNFMMILIENGLAEAGFENAWELTNNIPFHMFSVFPAVERPKCSDINEIFADDLRMFSSWWKTHIKDRKTKNLSKKSEIADLMTIVAARLVAMASASPITINEAIANLGDTLTNQAFGKYSKKFQFMFFTPAQDTILHQGSEKMILEGPPGSGKSIIMMYKCLELARAKQNENYSSNVVSKKILIICGYKAIGLKSMHEDFLYENLGSSYNQLVDIYTKVELDELYETPLLLFEKKNILSEEYCVLFIDELQSIVESVVKHYPSFASQISQSVDLLSESFHFVWLSVDPSQSSIEQILPTEYNESVWLVSKLKYTLRNTENIAKEVSHFTSATLNTTSGHRIKGTSPEWIDVRKSVEEKDHKHLIGIIHHLVERKGRNLKIVDSKSNKVEVLSSENLRFNDILVFWNTDDQGKHQSLLRVCHGSDIPAQMLSPKYSRNVDKVTIAYDIENILSMEFRVVIAMFVKYGREYEDKSFLVPVSRAMCHLIMLRDIDNIL